MSGQPKTSVAAVSTRTARGGTGLLDSAEVAVLLGTPVRFVRRLVAERRMPFIRVGKYVRFDRRDVEEYLVNNRVEVGFAQTVAPARPATPRYGPMRGGRPARRV